MKKIKVVIQVFVLVIFWQMRGYSVTIWSEDFENGYSDNDITAQSNNEGAGNNGGAVGADWTLSGQGNGYFRVDDNNTLNGTYGLMCRNTDAQLDWDTEVITISGFTNVEISLIYRDRNGGANDNENADDIEAFYNLDGGGWTSFGYDNNDVNTALNFTSPSLSGSSLQIRVRADTDDNDERWRFDDVLVTGDLSCNPCYSVADGDIDNPNTWSSASGGTPGAAIANDGTVDLVVEGGFKVSINTQFLVKDVTVGASGVGELEWTSGVDLRINNGGTVTVNSGSEIDQNGVNNASLHFAAGGFTYHVVINDVSPGLECDDFEILSDATVNVSGAGELDVDDDIVFHGDNASFNSTLTGTFDINDDVDFNAGDDNNTFTSNSTITVNRIVYKGSFNVVNNNGILNVEDDIYFEGQNDDQAISCGFVGGTGSTTIVTDDVYLDQKDDASNNYITNDGLFTADYVYCDAQNTTFTNTVNGTWTINDDMFCDDNFWTVINAGTMTCVDIECDDDVDDDFTLTNSGILNLEDFILGAGTGGDDMVITNTGTINQSGTFRNVKANESTVTNGTNARWNYAGTGHDSDLRLYCAASGNTFNYNRSGNQGMIEVQGNDYHHLEITESGTKTSVGDMDIEGNLLISGTAEFDVNTGNDDITLAGNWVNTSSVGFDQTNQKVTFDGTGAQSITCSTLGTETFHDLNINKSSGGTVILNNHVDLTDQMNFNGSHGYMSIGVYNLTINNWDNGDFIGYDENEFVVVDNTGLIQFSGVADGDVVNLPMGIGIGSANYGLTDVTLTDAGDGNFSGNLCNQVQADGGCGGTALSDYASGLTWNLNSTSNDAAVKLHWDTSKELISFDNTDCFVSLHSGGSWGELSAGSSAINEGGSLRSQSGSTTSFSSFSVGSSGGVLPIELWYFEVLVVGEHMLLKWSTAAEINNDYFTIERSADGVLWEEIGVVVGAGNSFTPLDYQFTDQFPIEGSSYYRLKQTDFDNKQQHHQKQEVFQEGYTAVPSSVFQMELYPNPVQGDQFFIKLLIGDPEQRILLTVYDAYGKQIQAQDLNQTKGQDLHAIRLADQVLAGMYFVVLHCKERAITKKIMIKR